MGVWSAFGNLRRFISDNLGLVGLSAACVVFTAAFLFFFYTPPFASVVPVQPISFSHRIHAGIKNIQCEFCHPYVGRSINPGVPAVEKCLFCHNYIITNHPEIKKEHHYYDTNTPTPWKKVFYVPEYVVFNHQRHIKKDIQCIHCHGDVATMDRLSATRFKMGFCVKCHREKGANLDCWLACHS